jgi:pimeloyl-ACP methyl ester carboxylesterase
MTEDYDFHLSVQGTGAPVVLASGMDGTGQLFYRQVSLLARSYRVATYALRDGASTMEQLVADLTRVVDTASPADRRAIVVGESFGGALALSFALARPEQVSALVILNSFPYFAPQIRLRLALLGLSVLPWGAMGLVRRLTAFRLHSRHTHRREARRFMALTASASRDGYVGRLRLLTRYDVRQRALQRGRPSLPTKTSLWGRQRTRAQEILAEQCGLIPDGGAAPISCTIPVWRFGARTVVR